METDGVIAEEEAADGSTKRQEIQDWRGCWFVVGGVCGIIAAGGGRRRWLRLLWGSRQRRRVGLRHGKVACTTLHVQTADLVLLATGKVL